MNINKFDFKLYLSLIILTLMPSIYTALRSFWIGNMPNTWAFSIAGQLVFIELIYEIINEAIILPLYYFIGESKHNREELINRVRTGLLLTFVLYLFIAIIICIFTKQILNLMATNVSYIEESISYIRLETIAYIFNVSYSFVLIVLISIGKSKYLYIITFFKLILCIVFDLFFISNFTFSLNLFVNGIAISNIFSNLVLLIISICILYKEEINIFINRKLNFSWFKELYKIGGISGLESFVRNFAYMFMIARMINVVDEQGTYWVCNNFIWGWLLIPILALAELIKKEFAENYKKAISNTKNYFFITVCICLLWIIFMPLYRPFMEHILNYDDVDKLLHLVKILLFFYMCYALQNIFDATFYGLGKTNYMLLESIVTNSIYYGIAFILFLLRVWIPTLDGIAYLFGFGMLFDSIVSLLVYIHLRKTTNKINFS